MSRQGIALPIPLPSELISDAPAFQQERTYFSVIDKTISEMERLKSPKRSKSVAEIWYGGQFDMADLQSFLENKGGIFSTKS